MNNNDPQFPVRLFGILAIVAGVFIVLGGGCIFLLEMLFGGGSPFGLLGLIAGVGMIFGGAQMIKNAKKQDD